VASERTVLNLLCDHLPAGPVILDASAFINLLGCGNTVALVKKLNAVLLIEQRTLKEINRHPVSSFDHKAVIDELVHIQLLKVERMDAAEYETYLSLVQGSLTAKLDDGESAAIAIATRGYPVLLDENKARRHVAARFPSISYCSTLRLLLTIGHRSQLKIQDIQALVLSARSHARMGVPKDDLPLLETLMHEVPGWSSNSILTTTE
jgi:predicted nucleic acid-binding protein